MLYEGTALSSAIELQSLPSSLSELFGDLYDADNARFLLQETTLIDFKETVPANFSEGYGAGIVRLALALHNTFGGVIVFGVVDRTLSIAPTDQIFNIEAFNRYLSDVTGARIECVLRRYPARAGDEALQVQVVLVPRRGACRPVRLISAVGKYPVGSLWVRDRHEVVEASSEHLPLLYSERSLYQARDREVQSTVHRSLPPSPSTVEEFIGRWELMVRLWDWLTAGDQPRLYLHGPGGSGKSTLAHAFASYVAGAEQPVCYLTGGRLDFVLYLSAKETEFDPLALQDQAYSLRDFSNAEEQVRQILFHSGLVAEGELEGLSPGEVECRLEELFANFNGLIVIDDIDALTRRGEDTGEEILFLKAVQAAGRTKILYTLRYPPPYAVRSALEVPGLRFEDEFLSFVEACSEQFEVPVPSAAASIRIAEEADRLPLLIETIIALRRTCSTYDDALRAYKDREGDAARKYLYQREYDRLDRRGKSSAVLCALSLVESAVTSTTIAHITSLSETQVRDAIGETRGIFLRTEITEGGDTLYAATQSSIAFLKATSRSLPIYPALQQAVQFYRRQKTQATPEEAAFILSLNMLARQGQHARIVEEAKSVQDNAPLRGNPRFLGLLGQGYADLGGAHAEDARECFRRAFALHHRDIYMLRAWYRLEMQSPHAADAAERLCRDLLESDMKLEPRYASEFYSKLGQILEIQARPHVYTNRERAIALLKESIAAYSEGSWLGRGVRGLDKNLQIEWITDAARKLYRIIENEIDYVFHVVEGWGTTGHDVDVDAARVIIEPLRLASRTHHPARARLIGLSRKAVARLSKTKGVSSSAPGFGYVLDALNEIIATDRLGSRELTT